MLASKPGPVRTRLQDGSQGRTGLRVYKIEGQIGGPTTELWGADGPFWVAAGKCLSAIERNEMVFFFVFLFLGTNTSGLSHYLKVLKVLELGHVVPGVGICLL